MQPEKRLTILFRAAQTFAFTYMKVRAHNDSNVHKTSVLAKEAHEKDVSETAIENFKKMNVRQLLPCHALTIFGLCVAMYN